jgi:hypothetical protein
MSLINQILIRPPFFTVITHGLLLLNFKNGLLGMQKTVKKQSVQFIRSLFLYKQWAKLASLVMLMGISTMQAASSITINCCKGAAKHNCVSW